LNLTLGWIVPVAAVVFIAVIFAVLARGRRGSRVTSVSLYIQALDALLAGDENRALDLLKETVRMDSGNVAAYIRLGTLFRERGEHGRAARIHREVSIRPRIDAAERELALSELALDYTSQGNSDKALATLDELRRRNKKHVFAYEAAAQLLEEQGDWDAAYDYRKDLARVVGDDGLSLAAFQAFVGHELARKGDLSGARDRFKEAFRRDKHSLPAYLYAGDLKYQQGKLDDAVDHWKNVIRHHVGHAHRVYGRLEKAYFDLGQFETMMDVYEEVLSRRPDDVATQLAVADFHRKKGDLDTAERAVSRILESRPDDRLAGEVLGLIRAERGDADGAASALSDLIDAEMKSREILGCSRCGHEVDEVLWRCPRCGGWRTFLDDQ